MAAQQQIGVMHPAHSQATMQQPQQAGVQASQQPGAAQAAPGQPPQVETDPIAKFKALTPRLKETLHNLFLNSAKVLYHNSQQDENGVPVDSNVARFDKSLEEFYAVCDQIEINLRLAAETSQQDRDSRHNTPVSVLVPPTKDAPPQPEAGLYTQYLSTVRGQIGCARDLRDALAECLRSFPDTQHP